MIITACALTFSAGRSEGSEFRIEPAMTVSEEYNDNIFLDSSNEAVDYITRVIPAFHSKYQASLWDWDVAYSYEYRYYAHRTYDAYSTQRLNLSNLTRVVPEFFFIRMTDVYSPVSLSLARDFTQESLNVNQSDQNIFAFNPYLVFHPTKRTMLTTGYQYRNIWYKDPRATDKVEDSVNAELQHELSERVMMTGTVSFLYTKASNTGTRGELRYNQALVMAGPKYEYQDRSTAWGKVGVSRIDQYDGNIATRFAWDAGVTHAMPATTYTIHTSRSWVDDPIYITRRQDQYLAAVKWTSEPTTLGATAGHYVYVSGNERISRRNSLSVSAGQGFTSRFRGSLALTFDAYQNTTDSATDTRTTSDRYLTDLRFHYLAAERLTLTCSWQYTNSYSPDDSINGYRSNRVTAEAKWTF